MSAVRRSLMNVNGEKDIKFPSTYFTTYAREAGVFTFSIPQNLAPTGNNSFNHISYSLDGGDTWTTVNNINGQAVDVVTPSVAQGSFICWKGKGSMMNGCKLTSTGQFDIGGDLFSLIFEDTYETSHTIAAQYVFHELFLDNANLIHAKHLKIEFDNTIEYCLYRTFKNCINLEDTPKITWNTSSAWATFRECFYGCSSLKEISHPFQTFDFSNGGNWTYAFRDCVSLEKVPDIYITAFNGDNMVGMFEGCTSLKNCPIKSLPNILANDCCRSMFNKCSNLSSWDFTITSTLASSCFRDMFNSTAMKEAPVLTADVLVQQCYANMFENCKNIDWIKMLATDISASDCLFAWLRFAKNTTDCVFVKNINATWTGEVPSNWKIIYYDTLEDKYYLDQNKLSECDDHGNPILN